MKACRSCAEFLCGEHARSYQAVQRISPALIADSAKEVADIKDMKREKRMRTVNKAQESTLAMLYEQGTHYPGHKLVQEICDREGMRRSVVIAWFEEKRKTGKRSYAAAEPDHDEVWD